MVDKVHDKNFAPVSFIRSGYQDSDQIHLEGTYAFLPRHVNNADEDGLGPGTWSAAEQKRFMGDVFWEPGIAPGFTPASASYLAGPGSQARIDALVEERVASRRAAAGQEGAPASSEGPASSSGDQALQSPAEPSEDEGSSDSLPTEVEDEDSDEEVPYGLPWDDVEDLTVAEIRERLAVEPDGSPVVDAYVEWETARDKPRVSILRELGVEGY